VLYSSHRSHIFGRWKIQFNPGCFHALKTDLKIVRSEQNLLDHSVGSCQHIRRNREADLLGCLKINDEIDPTGRLDRQVLGFDTSKNALDVLR